MRPPIAVGAVVERPDAGSGSVVAVEKAGPFRWVTVSYPPAWSCPSGAETPPGGKATAGAAVPTSPQPIGQDRWAATTCQELAARRRPALAAEADAQLAAARAALVAARCTPTTSTMCVNAEGQSVASAHCPYTGGGIADAGASAPAPSGPSAAPTGGAAQHSTTNTQVAGVDEADFVKNDDKLIYALSDGGLNVIEAWPAAHMRQVARVALSGEPRRLFLDGNRLVVFSRLQGTSARPGAGRTNPSDQGCVYGYGCRASSEGGHTLVTVFDVRTPSAPRELARYETSGAFVAARRVGSVVYTVVHDSGAAQVPGVDTSLSARSYDELSALYERRRADNAAKIAATPDAYFLPWMQHASGQAAGAEATCDDALATDSASGTSFISVVAFDTTTLEAPARTVIASQPGYVYGSATALYMAVDRAPGDGHAASTYGRAVDSVVHKLRLDGVRARYAGSATLPGHVLNQFAMDEQEGVLRVASTRGWVPDPDVVSHMSTYAEKNGSFTRIGELGGIAPTEDIRSVRFDGDRGYVVTFKKTDPLFLFDLADPTKPRMLGELKIPGYSTYMHRLDANHLLAVGFDADDKGDFAYFNGVQVQIFDVSDPKKPNLAWKTSIGTRGSTSEGLLNHLAFTYFAPKRALALPMTICDGGGNGSSGALAFSGLMVFDVSLEAGITERGRLPFASGADLSKPVSCDTWWTNASTLVKRTVFMDDFVYGITDTGIRVARLGQLNEPLQTITFGAATTPVPSAP